MSKSIKNNPFNVVSDIIVGSVIPIFILSASFTAVLTVWIRDRALNDK